jgi:hypothetical protein
LLQVEKVQLVVRAELTPEMAEVMVELLLPLLVVQGEAQQDILVMAVQVALLVLVLLVLAVAAEAAANVVVLAVAVVVLDFLDKGPTVQGDLREEAEAEVVAVDQMAQMVVLA